MATTLPAGQGPVGTALAAAGALLQTTWLVYVRYPVALAKSLVLKGQRSGDLLSLQTAVALQRRLEHAQQLALVLLLQLLAAAPQPVGRPLSAQAVRLLGSPPAAAAPSTALAALAGAAQPHGVKRAAGPVRVAAVLNELRCSQCEMLVLARLVLWCVCVARLPPLAHALPALKGARPAGLCSWA